ncbi:MAG: type III pantothenate kinase [Chthoniobacterales bacterium]|jgi:type III pantothenate kinase
MPRQNVHPLLVIDAGNSAVKFALVGRPGAAPRPVKSVPTAGLTVAAARQIGAGAQSVAISSVVPAVSRLLHKAFPRARFIGPRSRLEFTTLVDRRTFGSDRLANVAAIGARYGKNVLVASFGTATTFDIVDADGIHRGGAIAPGWQVFAGWPSAATALLPRATAKRAGGSIGKNTREALSAGTAGGYAAMVRQIIEAMRKEAGVKTLRIIATGGDAKTVVAMTRLKSVTDPLLTLRGIAILWAHGTREGSK